MDAPEGSQLFATLCPAGAKPSRPRSTVEATLSEELRTALNAIIGYSEMLQEEAQELGRPQFVADLEKIQRAGKHLLAVFTNFLERPGFEVDEILEVDADSVGPHDRVDSRSLHRADQPGG
jgi:K+-sensing histidine kinase KdpD